MPNLDWPEIPKAKYGKFLSRPPTTGENEPPMPEHLPLSSLWIERHWIGPITLERISTSTLVTGVASRLATRPIAYLLAVTLATC